MIGVLQTKENTHTTRSLDPLEVRSTVDPHKILALSGNESVPVGEEPERFQICISPPNSDGDVKDIDPGIFVWLEVGGGKAFGIGKPLRLFGKVEGERAEHIDNGRPLNQIDSPRCVFDGRTGEGARATEIDH